MMRLSLGLLVAALFLLGAGPSEAHHCLGGHADRPECAPTTTLGDLSCTTGQAAVFVGSGWVCTNLFAPKIVFVSTSAFAGDFGGTGFADSTCQSLADAEGIDGTFMAWVSVDDPAPGFSPLQRFTLASPSG